MTLLVRGSWLRVHDEMDIPQRLQEFIESEGKSCFMDIGGITPEYVYRSWGGSVAIEEIEEEMKNITENNTKRIYAKNKSK